MTARKNLGFFFLALISIVFLVATLVSAAPLATINKVEVDGTNASSTPAVVVGDEVAVRVEFASLANVSEVTVNVELKGDKEDAEAITRSFDVESGKTYSKTLKVQVPFDLKDTLSGVTTLEITVRGRGGFETVSTYTLRVQRESFSADIKSVSVPQTVKAGENFPVDVVLKNLGYNNLDDVYVTAKISSLDIERASFLGDIVAIECDEDSSAVVNYGVDVTRKCNEDDQDTVTGRVFLQVPYDVKSGVYTLDVTVENDDTVSSETVEVKIENAFSSGRFIVSGNQLLIVNPTNEVVVYRLIPETTGAASVTVSDSVVAVPAGSSRSVTVDATSSVAGTQVYSISVFDTSGRLVDTVSFSKNVQSDSSSSPIVVLTVVLAIVFVVLLVVLIVLIGKKPEKEEFGESYY